MTTLHDLANAISDSSPNVKAFAVAVADKLEPVAPPPPPPPPPPTTTRASFVGVNTNDPAGVAKHGVHLARRDIYALSRAQTDAAKAAGVSVIPILDYAMGVTSGDHVGPVSSSDQAKWATVACDKLAAVFASPGTVEAYEVWNEPFLGGFWQPTPNPAAYLGLVGALTAETIRRGWTAPKVLVSSDPGFGGWGDNLLAADTAKLLANPRFLPTVHPYCNNRSPATVTAQPKQWDFQRYTFVYDAWKAHGHPDPQVWLSEFGWQSVTSGQGVSVPDGPAVSEADQAAFTEAAYEIAFKSGKVARAFAYKLSPGDTESWNWLRNDGSEKPVVAAVKSWIAA